VSHEFCGQLLSSAGLGIAVGDFTFEEGTVEALKLFPWLVAALLLPGRYTMFTFLAVSSKNV
jgi:hypothetical protein